MADEGTPKKAFGAGLSAAAGLSAGLVGVGAGIVLALIWSGGGSAEVEPNAPRATSTRAAPSATRTTPAQITSPSAAATQPPASPAPVTPAATVAEPTPTPTPAPETPTPTPEPPPPTPTIAAPTPVPPPPTPIPTPVPVALSRGSWSLPGDGVPGGAGPFRGPGRGITVTSTGGVVVGYAYFFSWGGSAFDAPRANGGTDSLYPDIRVLISDAASGGVSAISFSAADMESGSSRSASVGRLSFTVTLANVEKTTFNGGTYVYGSTLTASLRASLR